MIRRGLIIFFIGFCFCTTLQAQVNCRFKNISYKTVNNLQNASLEQDLSTCLTSVAGADFTLSKTAYLPHWRCTTTSSAIWFLGECNQYGIPPAGEGNVGLPEPLLPIPDGKGMMAFADHVNVPVSNKKRNKTTYLANCLAATLQKDFFYRFDFYLGFGRQDHRYDTVYPYSKFQFIRSKSPSPMAVTLYGFSDSTKLPIAVEDAITGCLSSLQKGWIELGTVTVTGDSLSWVKSSIEFTAPANINVLAIGPACNSKPAGTPDGYYFYFVDKLQLYQSYVPNAAISVSAGSFCDGVNPFTTLQMDYAHIYRGSKLQWYKNNVAINETGSTITINKNNYGAGWYQCAIQNDSVCIRSDSLYVNWVPKPSQAVIGGTDTTMCNGETLVLNAATAGSSYWWNDSTTLATKTIIQAGTYSVQIANACDTFTAVKNVQFKDCPASFYVPSAFTPNNDGLNDVFKPYLKGSAKQFAFSVYNRAGQRIFYTTDISKGWNGIFNGLQQGQGTYVWTISYTNSDNISHTEKGTVVLIR